MYLGEKLPSYAGPSLRLAAKHSGLDVVLLGNQNLKKQISEKSVEFLPIEDFYTETDFLIASKRLTSPSSFRSGFWHRTLERFFVLEQYMKAYDKEAIFHAELDQLLFRTDILLENLVSSPFSGLFFPIHTEKYAVASVMYCNSLGALESLVKFSQNCEVFANEMELLSKWSAQNSSQAHFLPTIADKLDLRQSTPANTVKTLEPRELKGLVDAAQLGMWAGGLDPRNDRISKLSLTKFVDTSSPGLLTHADLTAISFEFHPEDSHLRVHHPDVGSVSLYNLHLHSKIHGWLSQNEKRLKSFFISVNNGRIPFIPSVLALKVRLFVTRALPYLVQNPHRLWRAAMASINLKLNIRPSSSPYISGDTFRSIADFIWEEGNCTLDARTLKPGSIVFCQSHLFSQFSKNILKNTNVPLIVILGNSDYNFTSEDESDFDTPSFAWGLAQNMSVPVNQVEPLPIGLENAWRKNNGVKSDFDSLRRAHANKKNRIMWTFTIGTNDQERSSATGALLRSKSADNLGPITQKEHQRALKEYSFVASPPGNGLDTHRTWEALYLGCIPIVKRSFMTETFENLGLPIWVIDSYEELASLEESELEQKYKTLSKNLDHRALWTTHWIKIIMEKSKALKGNLQH